MTRFVPLAAYPVEAATITAAAGHPLQAAFPRDRTVLRRSQALMPGSASLNCPPIHLPGRLVSGESRGGQIGNPPQVRLPATSQLA